MMKNKKSDALLKKYNKGTCTEEEKAIIESWFINRKEEGTIPSKEKIESISREVWDALPVHEHKKTDWTSWQLAAAAIARASNRANRQ